MTSHPLFLDLDGRRALVVGSGLTAERRAVELVGGGADVHVIGVELRDTLQHRVRWTQRAAQADDDFAAVLDGVLFVVAADEPAVNAVLVEQARAVGAFVHRADEPEAGTWRMPAVARRGSVTVAVTTGVPAISQALTSWLAPQLDGWSSAALTARSARTTHPVD